MAHRMLKTTLSILLIVAISFQAKAIEDNLIFGLYFNLYKNNTVELLKFHKIQGEPNLYAAKSDYKVILKSGDSRELFTTYINPVFQAHVDRTDGKPSEDLNITYFQQYVRLPFFEDADTLNIYYKDNIIFHYRILNTLQSNFDKLKSYSNNLLISLFNDGIQ